MDPLGSHHSVLFKRTFGLEILDRTRRNPSPNFCCPSVLPRNRRLRKAKFIQQNAAMYVIYVVITLFVDKASEVPTIMKLDLVTNGTWDASILPSIPTQASHSPIA